MMKQSYVTSIVLDKEIVDTLKSMGINTSEEMRYYLRELVRNEGFKDLEKWRRKFIEKRVKLLKEEIEKEDQQFEGRRKREEERLKGMLLVEKEVERSKQWIPLIQQVTKVLEEFEVFDDGWKNNQVVDLIQQLSLLGYPVSDRDSWYQVWRTRTQR